MPDYRIEVLDNDGTVYNDFTTEGVQAVQVTESRAEGSWQPSTITETFLKIPVYRAPGYEEYDDSIPISPNPTDPSQDLFFYSNLRLSFEPQGSSIRARVTEDTTTIADISPFEISMLQNNLDPDAPPAGEVCFLRFFFEDVPAEQGDFPDAVPSDQDAPYPRPWQN